jgi:hypothetical protein
MNLSILDQAGESQLSNQVKDPPTIGRSISPCSKMNSKNFNIIGHKPPSPDLSLGKGVTLKSPQTHQGKFHQVNQLTHPTNALISIKIRAINTRKSLSGIIFNFFEGDNHGELSHTFINLLHHPSIPDNQNTT